MTNRRAAFERDVASYSALLESLRSACARNKIPTTSLDSLLTDTEHNRALTDRLVKQIQQDAELNQALSEPLPKDHYLLTVNRGPWPSRSELARVFSYQLGDDMRVPHNWQPHPSRELSRASTAKQVIGYAHLFEKAVSLQAAFDWGLSRGYIPANEQELYAFGLSARGQEEHRGMRIRALGSSYSDDPKQEPVAAYLAVSHPRYFKRDGYGLYSHRIPWHIDSYSDHILFVKPYAPHSTLSENPAVIPVKSRDFVTVPNISAQELLARIPNFTSKRPSSSWRFDMGEASERQKTFRADVCWPNTGTLPKNLREDLAKQGFFGHVGAFIQWCLEHQPVGNYIVLPDHDQLEHGDPLYPQTIAYTNREGAPPAFHMLCVLEPYKLSKDWSVVGFRYAPPST